MTAASERPWAGERDGVIELPSGRCLRGRGLVHPVPTGLSPQFGLYLLGSPAPEFPWATRWLRWPDFRLPSDAAEAKVLLVESWQRAASERVEVACRGGVGRTGTALACMAVMDGVAPADAVAYVREHYHPKAVETARQRRFVANFRP